METKLLTLESLYGFVIYITEQGLKNNARTIRNRGRIVTSNNNEPIRFGSADMAILYADIALGLHKNDYKLKVIKFDSKKNKIVEICNFESMQEFSNNTYQVIVDDMCYYIKENKVDTVKSIRYFVFENGDSERTEKTYGRKRNKALMRLIIKAATEYLYTSGILSGVKRVSPDEIEISFKNSSARMHVMTNGLISNINKIRKENNEGLQPQFTRCIPFDNSLDKYTTIFSFVTKNIMEPDGFGYMSDIDNDIERCYQYIENYILDLSIEDSKFSTFKYRPIEFNGTILCKEY